MTLIIKNAEAERLPRATPSFWNWTIEATRKFWAMMNRKLRPGEIKEMLRKIIAFLSGILPKNISLQRSDRNAPADPEFEAQMLAAS